VASPFALLLAPAWRARLAVLAAVAALGFIGYQPGALLGAFFASRVLHLAVGTISLILIVSAPFMIAGYLVGGWLSDRTGRRPSGVALSLASGAMSGITFAGTTAAYWFGQASWSLFAGAAQPVVAAWFAELFPTRARVTSQAVSTVAAAIGGIIGLQVVGRLGPGYGLGPALVAVSVGPLLAAILLGLLPETRGKPLPQ
jgi:MFS family permease